MAKTPAAHQPNGSSCLSGHLALNTQVCIVSAPQPSHSGDELTFLGLARHLRVKEDGQRKNRV